MTSPLETYQQEIKRLNTDLKILEKRKSLFGWLRLLTMGLAFVSLWGLWTNGMLFLLPLLLLFIALFLFILSKDLNNNDAIENLQRLVQINETEIEVLNHHFTHLPDGSQYKPELHEYANDLDIFGRASLYQYINRTKSEQGNKLFAGWLLHPAKPEAILQRQQAVKELTTELKWRQQLQSHGAASPISFSTQQKVDNWLKEPNTFSNKSYWRVLKYLLPATSFVLLILHIADILSSSAFYPLIILMLGLSFIISKQVMPFYLQLDKVAPQLESLSDSIKWIEQKELKSDLLNQLKANFKTESGTSSQSIKKLKSILDRFDIRLNPLIFIPLNTFSFWDLQQIFVLEKWKTENKESIDEWFHALAEIECLSTLANFHFNHPENTFPLLSGKQGVFNAEELGHPLIPKEKLVCNSFATEGLNQINLITGSNMGGKSTFLRSVGVNIVLAMMGSSVHAISLTLSPMKVLSSMRVSDNLEESTSTFYAELKKLKEVIDAVYSNEKIFLLLDEILRGTNSGDRHTGSKALIKQLIQHKAAGLIATHDLELAKLADEFPANIHNYHFDVQVANDELYFDYKLKRGVCQSMNASLLMKKIGIEL
jgi:DNA mismatch repair ATPase MutS